MIFNLVDTHCHLQSPLLDDSRESCIRHAQKSGIAHMVCCATNQYDWTAVKILAESHPAITPAFGIHPWFLDSLTPSWRGELETLLAALPRAAIGECGLDHMVSPRNDRAQETVFKEHLTLAHNHARAISVHCRKAWGDLTRILATTEHSNARIILHAYSGSLELIPFLTSRGCFFSVSPSITNPRSKKSRAVAAAIPLDRLVIETDRPGLPGNGEKYMGYEPELLSDIADTLGTILQISPEELAKKTYENSVAAFVL